MDKLDWQEWLIGIVGVWLIASPFLLPYTPAEGASALIPGGTAFIMAGALTLALLLLGWLELAAWQLGAGIILAIVLIISPWLFGFASVGTSVFNAVVSGVVLGLAVLGEWVLPNDDQRISHH
ncbi:SPW repeat domain-containing protein [Histidinibacterium aquaticum]|uniref:SPW repeat-containing integral membrane domain-containing protein n=1 Tax=Histidinibacterium aquaticum TaxID=2613962 RepID=A0A5J5GA57_9RHOB|nr:SPW repeat protein [Histidinibacterium aquaticum]KAA9005006.1 hypothetical protein F3S47_19080 [Histidinibacterium aquaticum]